MPFSIRENPDLSWKPTEDSDLTLPSAEHSPCYRCDECFLFIKANQEASDLRVLDYEVRAVWTASECHGVPGRTGLEGWGSPMLCLGSAVEVA